MSPNLLTDQPNYEAFRRIEVEPAPEAEIVKGMRIERVQVSDGFEAENPELRAEIQATLEYWDVELQRHPEWQAPRQDPETKMPIVDPANKASMWHYSTESQRQWGSLMPTALALHPLQRPESAVMPNGAHIDDRARELFKHSIDAIGIRSRAAIMTDIALEIAKKQETNDMKWVSIACGAAVPVLSAIERIKAEQPEKAPKLELIDLDPQALAFAKTLAEEQGLEAGRDFTTRRSNIIKDMLVRDTLIDELGEQTAQMVDGLGIFEYFRDDVAVSMLQKMHRLVAPGGSLVIGNMLEDRPQLEFNRRAVGWPKIYPRALEDLSDLVQQAGIPIENVTTYIPEDGVYAVVSIEKPQPRASRVTTELGARAVEQEV
ncbi:MAG TPA: class I SAM-dependent methyltransferase family protein [Verrucomicrobiae bacterium]|nr:class I SAM-dependent methyltransferase family protein [Verrucomicrobiae bacterium]